MTNTPEVDRKNPALLKSTGPQAKENREKFDKLRQLAEQRDKLLEALGLQDRQKIFEAYPLVDESGIEPGKAWASQLPLVSDPAKLNGKMTAGAQQYVAYYGLDRELMDYAQWCDRYHDRYPLCVSMNDADTTGSPSLSKSDPHKVRELCVALRKLDERADELGLEMSARAIMAMITRNKKITVLELTQQTYVSTRMMLEKTVLLAEYGAGPTLNVFREKLVEAHKTQEEATSVLQSALRRVQPKWTRAIPLSGVQLVGLCVNVYAHCMTNPADEPIPKAVTPAQLTIVWKALDSLLRQPEGTLTLQEIVAMEYLMERISERVDAWDRQLRPAPALASTPPSSQ
ncbi:hypothetical protein [Hydrogenophaga sp.]|uniref:hypothetical protein n=1 Tax=Hydrogenophaga sp. TaxID=1904254 RepID=UPI0027164BB7|nr:hypothetical protein [Hydrogenophaga sp.]MDO9434069.1 hypothetical protein [Hydrogenophaga sp.]